MSIFGSPNVSWTNIFSRNYSFATKTLSPTLSIIATSSNRTSKVIEETDAYDLVEPIVTTRRGTPYPIPDDLLEDNYQTPKTSGKDSLHIPSNEGTILAHYRRRVQKCNGHNCANCSANLLLMINCFIAFTGLGLATVGVWLMLEQEDIYRILGEADVSPREYIILLISVGVVVTVLAALYICVLVTKTPKLLALYIVLLSLNLGGTIALAVYFVHFGDNVADGLEDGLAKAIADGRYMSKDHEDLTASINAVHEKFHCCGSRNEKDYELDNSLPTRQLRQLIKVLGIPRRPTVPASCCKDCRDQGCAKKVVDWFDFLNHILIAALCAVSTLQVVSLGSAAILFHFLAPGVLNMFRPKKNLHP